MFLSLVGRRYNRTASTNCYIVNTTAATALLRRRQVERKPPSNFNINKRLPTSPTIEKRQSTFICKKPENRERKEEASRGIGGRAGFRPSLCRRAGKSKSEQSTQPDQAIARQQATRTLAGQKQLGGTISHFDLGQPPKVDARGKISKRPSLLVEQLSKNT